MQNREKSLNKWLEEKLNGIAFSIKPLAGDASFRQYFRLFFQKETRIVMDAPPDKEAIEPFLQINTLLNHLNIKTPQVHAFDLNEGFAILDDLGDELLLSTITSENADQFYQEGFEIINKLHLCSIDDLDLPSFDHDFMQKELLIFKDWFLNQYLKINLSHSELEIINESLIWLTTKIAAQPLTLIHRDFHSRNLMVCKSVNSVHLSVIDFQDAMIGPFTYDLVSLLKDCYIQWPPGRILDWVSYFYTNSPWTQVCSLPQFIEGFHLCGLQRHLKVLGVFARLYLRDKKPQYLHDLPRTFRYVLDCLETHKELQDFYQFMQNRIHL